MKKLFTNFQSILLCILCSTLTLSAQSIEGRWDITITKDDKKIPSWLEVNHSGNKYLNGRFVGSGGSARPISRVNFTASAVVCVFTDDPSYKSRL